MMVASSKRIITYAKRILLFAAALGLFLGAARLSSSIDRDHRSQNNQQRGILQDDQIINNITATQLRGGRRLDSSNNFQCPPISRPPPHHPPLPILQRATYAASFPGSGDRMITKYLVESVTGLFVEEASVSPSLAKMKALRESNVGEVQLTGGDEPHGQGDVVVVRSHFPHTSGKLVRGSI